MSYEKLKSQLKTGNFSQLIHFYGDEAYLKSYYLDKCADSIVTDFAEFNRILFDGNINANDLSVAIQTPPMMSDKKLIILKNTGIFTLSAGPKGNFVGNV